MEDLADGLTEVTLPLTEEEESFSIFFSQPDFFNAFLEDPADNPCFQELYNRTNVALEFMVVSSDAEADRFKVLAASGGLWFSTLSDIASFDDLDPDAVIEPAPTPGRDAAYTGFMMPATMSRDRTCLSVSTNCENMELAARYLDYLFSEEGQLLSNYGVEGLTFEYDENGDPQFTEFITNSDTGFDSSLTMVLYGLGNFPGAFNPTRYYISQMCEEVHFYGSKITLNTTIVYPDGYSLYGGRGFGPHGKPTEVIPLEKIPEAVELTMDKLRLYRHLGYDGVSFRCDAYMAPGKARDDAYTGQTVEGRTRLFHELCAAMRKEFGKKWIIEAVLAWEQQNGYGGNAKMGSGYTAEDALTFCRLFDDVVDILEVREHDGCASHPTGYNFVQGVHPAVDFCARAKAAGVRMLLKPIGGFQEPEEMERYLVEGKCDMFGVARAFMADAEYGKKLYAGRGEDITPCLKCNKCHGVMLPEPEPWVSICSVNPLHGLGHKLHRLVETSAEPKKVAVIGGGPAGMRAAIYAAQRGHDVTLYEKSGELGGQLFHSDYFPFKWPVKNFKSWLIYELGKSGVKVLMNTEPTQQMIVAGGYDAVLAATGAGVNIPNIPGLKDENGELKSEYLSWADAARHPEKLGKKVVIVGGSEVGTETAMYLCGLGHDVTILTRQRFAGYDYHSHGAFGFIMALQQMGNPACITEVRTTRIEKGGVYYVDKEGTEQSIICDDVIFSGGRDPMVDETMAFAGLAPVFRLERREQRAVVRLQNRNEKSGISHRHIVPNKLPCRIGVFALDRNSKDRREQELASIRVREPG